MLEAVQNALSTLWPLVAGGIFYAALGSLAYIAVLVSLQCKWDVDEFGFKRDLSMNAVALLFFLIGFLNHTTIPDRVIARFEGC